MVNDKVAEATASTRKHYGQLFGRIWACLRRRWKRWKWKTQAMKRKLAFDLDLEEGLYTIWMRQWPA